MWCRLTANLRSGKDMHKFKKNQDETWDPIHALFTRDYMDFKNDRIDAVALALPTQVMALWIEMASDTNIGDPDSSIMTFLPFFACMIFAMRDHGDTEDLALRLVRSLAKRGSRVSIEKAEWIFGTFWREYNKIAKKYEQLLLLAAKGESIQRMHLIKKIAADFYPQHATDILYLTLLLNMVTGLIEYIDFLYCEIF